MFICEEPVITADPTIQDGLCIRWYVSESAVLHSSRPFMSASRNGVVVETYLHQIDPEWLAQANGAYEDLASRRPERIEAAKNLATHRKVGPLFRTALERIEREPETAAA